MRLLKPRKGFVIFIVAIAILAAAAGIMETGLIKKTAPLECIKENSGVTRLGDDIRIFHGTDFTNVSLIVSGNNAALVDTGYAKDAAEAAKKYIDQNNLKLKYIFLTHRHSDHARNLIMFKSYGAETIENDNTEDGQTVRMGSKTFRVVDTRGHMPGDSHISIELAKEHVLFSGDVVTTNDPPALGGSMGEMKATLSMIDNNAYKWIVPGHGDIVDPKLAVKRNRDYIIGTEKAVRENIKAGAKPEDIFAVPIEECISDMSYMETKNFKYIHQFDIKQIYREILNEK